MRAGLTQINEPRPDPVSASLMRVHGSSDDHRFIPNSGQKAGHPVDVGLVDLDQCASRFPSQFYRRQKVTMGIALSLDTVKAGEMTFEDLNSSKETIHEMIITRLRDLTILFPYNSSESKLDED